MVESIHVFSGELGQKSITGKHEPWNAGQLVRKAVSFLYYDPRTDKFRRKEIYSYGFVNNEVESDRTDTELRLELVSQPSPKQFEGIRWRSYLQKLSEAKIAMGLEWAKGEGEFKRYGETIAVKEP